MKPMQTQDHIKLKLKAEVPICSFVVFATLA